MDQISNLNRASWPANENNWNILGSPLIQACQDHGSICNQSTSLYNIIQENSRINLYIYNIESKHKEVKILLNPGPIRFISCIAQLPNNKLFCVGKWDPLSAVILKIDENCEAEVFPSGNNCWYISCSYFNNNVYCFGGRDINDNALTAFKKFDLNANRWTQLASMPKTDWYSNSVIFNRNILISGYKNRNILLYSIDIDSFSTIPHNFRGSQRKILVSAERLFLFECSFGSLYESEIGNEYVWTRVIPDATIKHPCQLYCSHYKGVIYIGTMLEWSKVEYYKFDLNKKVISNLY